MLSAEITKWIVLILIIGAVIFIIKAGMKIINVIISILVLILCWYSFFTEEGSARLTIALRGKPFTAYTTTLTKDDNKSTNEITYFKSSKDVYYENQKQEYVKCFTKWIVRLPDVMQ